MKKIRGFKKAGSAAGIVLAAVLAFGTTSKAAHAAYLGTDTVSLTSTTGSIPFEVNYTSGGLTNNATLYYTTKSTYGATIPTPAQINAAGITGTINSISTLNNDTNYVPVTFYNPSSGQKFTLKQIQTITDPYTYSGPNSASIGGDILSNVFQVVGGSHSGDLVFTYQFNVTSVSVKGTTLASGSVAFFNEPLNASTGIGYPWTLGDGINGTFTTTSGFTNDAIGSQLGGTLLASTAGQSTVTYDTVTNGNNSVESINYIGANIGLGDVSPQFFVASNATSYSIGSFSFEGVGVSGPGEPVFVPGTPEPGTLVLFGTALGLVAFMAMRRRRSQSVA